MVLYRILNDKWSMVSFEISIKSIDIERLKSSFLISGSLVVIWFFWSLNPMVNFLNQYYFGQNKIGINKLSSIAGNTWRGFSSSAESIGEYYAL